MKTKWTIFLIGVVVASILIAIQAPIVESKEKQSYKNVYHYHMQSDLDAVHDRIIETGLRDLCIGVQLYEIVDHSGNPSITIDELLQEINWAKKVAKGNGSVGLFIYNETTRVGYDTDGIYRYYRKWEQRLPVLEAIADSGIDYYAIDLGVLHYSSLKDLTTYILAMRGIFQEGNVEFGIYDGDAARDILDYELLKEAGIYVWSDIYIEGGNSAFLRSPAGWNYPYLTTINYMGSGSWQYNELSDFLLTRDLMIQEDFKGYNVIMANQSDGILPKWVDEYLDRKAYK